MKFKVVCPCCLAEFEVEAPKVRKFSDEERQRRAENMRRLRAEGVISRRGCKDKGPRKTRSDKGVARKKEA